MQRHAALLLSGVVVLFGLSLNSTMQASHMDPSEQEVGDAAPDSRTAADQKTNRLSRESSPYLLLHAHNPVDWYPWGPEAFEKARAEGKPIFLSIGYSSCYWCHVMEREVFSSPAIAAYMNAHFVNIKVDREERPDVDDIYMTSLIVYQQAAGIGGGGGWPLSLFLTPDGNPIGGATYLPPEDSPDGRSGFLTVAQRVESLWQSSPDTLRKSAAAIAAEVRRLSGPKLVLETVELDDSLIRASIEQVQAQYDRQHGGVDFRPERPNAPRFPSVPRLQLLLTQCSDRSDDELLSVVQHSLRAMAHGGIRDHLGGGFHRYSTDRRWHVPHFEKMLYDQAQLLEIYSQAARRTGDPLFHQVAGEISDFIQRELTLPDGGFCSALDAETNAIEGEYYVWSEQEFVDVLGAKDAQLFGEVYGLKAPNPFEHGFVLHLPESLEAVARRRSMTEPELLAQLAPLKQKLLQVRSRRTRPLLDDKVLTEWNALMIQALSESGRLPGRTQDLEVAARAARFLLTSLKDSDGHLMRSWREGQSKYRAYLDDYAFLVSALLRLHEATQEDQWLHEAAALMEQQIAEYYDVDQETFFYTSHDHEQLLARTTSAYDSTFPSGNSVTVLNLLALREARSRLTPHASEATERYPQIAQAVLRRFSGTLRDAPAACSGMAMALRQYLESPELESAAVVPRRPHTAMPVLTAVTAADDQNPGGDEAAPQASHDDTQDSVTGVVFKPVFPDPEARGTFAKDEKAERPVQAKVYPHFDKLERGGKCPIALELVIDPAWHINSNPSSPSFLVPTEVKVTCRQKVKLTRVLFPRPEKLEVPGADQPYHVYSGKVMLYGILETSAQETADSAELEIRLIYQACNENTCMPPDQIVLKGKLPLANMGDPIRRIHEDKFPKPKAPTDGGSENGAKP